MAPGVLEETAGRNKALYLPPVTRDQRLADLVNRNAQERITADMSSRFPQVKHAQDIPAVRFVLLDTQDDDTVRHEVANLLRRSGYRGLTADLISILNNPAEKERFRSMCIQHLYLNHAGAREGERKTIRTTLHTSLEDRHVKVRREALLALHRLKDPKAEELALAWLSDQKETGVRDLAIRIVREKDLRDQIGTIRKCVRDENPVVAIAAIVTLSQWRDEASRSAFDEAARSSHPRLQRAGKAALARLNRK